MAVERADGPAVPDGVTAKLELILRLVGELEAEIDPLLWKHTRVPNIETVTQMSFDAGDVYTAKRTAVELHRVARSMDAVDKELVIAMELVDDEDDKGDRWVARYREQADAEVAAMKTRLATLKEQAAD